MRILSCGPIPAERNNTTCHRSDWLRANSTEFCEIDTTPKTTMIYRIINKLSTLGIKINLPDNTNANKRIIDEVSKHAYDIIWIDKGNTIYPSTLLKIKELQPKCKLVHYMIDDFMNPNHKTRQIIKTIPLYDYYIVNRTANVEELKQYGCKNPICIFMTYESKFHYPRIITDEDKIKLGGDVGFIGTYEDERAESICFLADHGVYVRVWGNGWEKLKNYSSHLHIEGKGLYNDNFCKAIGAFKINLGFLRKKSRDLHTTRSSEIPACGGFMLAERTDEHLAMFKEGKEAAFFSSNEELLEKCKYYLEHEEERVAIAEAGRKRCIASDYSNEGMIKKVLKIINQL